MQSLAQWIIIRSLEAIAIILIWKPLGGWIYTDCAKLESLWLVYHHVRCGLDQFEYILPSRCLRTWNYTGYFWNATMDNGIYVCRVRNAILLRMGYTTLDFRMRILWMVYTPADFGMRFFRMVYTTSDFGTWFLRMGYAPVNFGTRYALMYHAIYS